MSLSETAHRNHERWFPNHASTLKTTDPEFIELFDNFAFDEVFSHGNLDDRVRLMVILAALIASQSHGEFKVMLRAALNAGVSPVEVKEIVYQAVPYCGIAGVYEFLHVTNETLKSFGIRLPLPGQSTTTPRTRMEQGLAVQKAIFGGLIDRMREEAPATQVHFQDYLSDNCFGDYYTRAGLDLRMRELLTLSMLAALGGCEPQLRGHIQGNVQVGNDKGLMLNVLTQLLPYLGYPRILNAIHCLNEVLPESA